MDSEAVWGGRPVLGGPPPAGPAADCCASGRPAGQSPDRSPSLRAVSVAYIGWFGPRGLASLVFGLLAFEEHLPGVTQLSGVIAVTVGLSVLLHGATAPFLGNRYGDWFARTLRTEPGLRENALTADTEGAAPGTRGSHGP